MGYFERFVSRRYLFTRERRALVSIITIISIAGVTVGVAALIVVLGIIDGIDRDIFSKIVEIYPHVKITDIDGRGITEPEKILGMLRERPDVKIAEPVISKQVLFSSAGASHNEPQTPGILVGVDKLGKGQLYEISGPGGSTIELSDKQIILSYILSIKLGVHLYDSVIVTTGNLVKGGGTYRPRMRQLQVAGIFRSGLMEFDEDSAFVSNATARETFGMAEAADYIHVKIKDPFAAREAKAALGAALGPQYHIATWEEENGEFFQALKLEKLGLFVILMLVSIVASFNIIGTLILTVIQKTREIGILKAIGSSEGMIHQTFMNTGISIGVIGTLCGLVLGLTGCIVIKYFVHLNIPAQVFAFDRLPVVVKPLTVLFIVACSMGISLVAALFPAAQAARLNPVEALRHD